MTVNQESLVHALAGSVGGAGAMALTYPLDQLRTLQQADEKTRLSVSRLYQGIVAVIETVAVSNFFYFYSAQYTKSLVEKRIRNPILASMTTSTLAAAANVLVTEPLWKANTVLKTMKGDKARGENLLSVLITLAKKDGLKSLWSGIGVSLWLILNPVIQFSLYEVMKKISKKKPLSALHAFFLGALCKAVATVLTYPLQVAQTRLRLASQEASSMKDVLIQLFRDRGLSGLFQGCSAKLSQTVLTAAFMFAFYERIVQQVSVYLKKKHF